MSLMIVFLLRVVMVAADDSLLDEDDHSHSPSSSPCPQPILDDLLSSTVPQDDLRFFPRFPLHHHYMFPRKIGCCVLKHIPSQRTWVVLLYVCLSNAIVTSGILITFFTD